MHDKLAAAWLLLFIVGLLLGLVIVVAAIGVTRRLRRPRSPRGPRPREMTQTSEEDADVPRPQIRHDRLNNDEES